MPTAAFCAIASLADSSTTFSILEIGTILNGNQHFSPVPSY